MTETSQDSNTLYRNLTIFLGIAFLVALLLPYLYLRYAPTDFEALNNAMWKKVPLGYPYILVEVPVELENKSRAPSWKEQEFFQYQQTYSFEDGRDFIVSASIVNYNFHVYIDPNAAEQSVNAYRDLYGAEDIHYSSRPIVLNDLPGKRIDGTFTAGARQLAFTRLSFEYKHIVRDLLVVVRDGDVEAANVRERIVNSMQIDNNY